MVILCILGVVVVCAQFVDVFVLQICMMFVWLNVLCLVCCCVVFVLCWLVVVNYDTYVVVCGVRVVIDVCVCVM